MTLVVAPFDAPGCLGRVGSRRSVPANAVAERVAFGRVPDKIGRQKGRADRSKAGKRDNQIHRARGTRSSNPVPSSGESPNFRFRETDDVKSIEIVDIEPALGVQ